MSNAQTTQSKSIPAEASAAPSGVVWTLDPAHTHIGFTVRHLGLTRTPGIFKRFSGQFAFDDLNIEASSGTFEVDAASIDTALDLRDEHLRGSEWFDVQAYPKIVFVSRAVRHIEGRQYVIDGDLTLRGITLPIAFNMTLIDRAVNPWTQAPVIGFEAVTDISRSAYGMSAFPGALSDEVRLTVSIELVRAEQN